MTPDMATAILGISSTLLGGGFGAAWMRYRLGSMRVASVEAPTAAAKAFEIAMKVQSQLNDSVNANVKAMQTTIVVLQTQVASLEQALHERDMRIEELTSELHMHEKDAEIAALQKEAERKNL